MSASTASGPKGITAHAASAGIKVSIGAKMNRNLLAPVGTIVSLNMSLMASAIGCSSPIGPTRLGPRRICIQPMSFLSHKVRYATQANSGSTMHRIRIVFFTSVQASGPHCGPSHAVQRPAQMSNTVVMYAPPKPGRTSDRGPRCAGAQRRGVACPLQRCGAAHDRIAEINGDVGDSLQFLAGRGIEHELEPLQPAVES